MTVREKLSDDGFRRTATMAGVLLSCLVSIATLGGLVFAGGEFRAETREHNKHIDDQLDAVAAAADRHYQDKAHHMPFEIKVEHFVLRSEWERQNTIRDREIGTIKESQLRAEAKLDRIIESLTNR